MIHTGTIEGVHHIEYEAQLEASGPVFFAPVYNLVVSKRYGCAILFSSWQELSFSYFP
jgi:hypothetical protein